MFVPADAAFTLADWLIKPLSVSQVKNAKHTLFNIGHSSTRMVVERTFGLFKRQWKLFGGTASEVGPETMVTYVECGMIFHNIMRRRGDTDADMEDTEEDAACAVTSEIQQDMAMDLGSAGTCLSRSSGRIMQDIIADELWQYTGPAWMRRLRRNPDYVP